MLAGKIIALAKAGERNATSLRDRAYLGVSALQRP
jgi:hypothetical protein